MFGVGVAVGTWWDGTVGHLLGADSDAVDRKAWLEPAKGDRHQFRIIGSADDGMEYDDLKPLTRRLMQRAEEDLGTKLDWVAADHYNTGHPHTHIMLRGKDERGQDLIVARDYITHGLRERACELVDLDLGPRRSEEHTSELQSLMRISYAVFCLKKKKNDTTHTRKHTTLSNITT